MLGPLEFGTTIGEDANLGRRQVRLFDLQGDHYELGYQQGLQMSEPIRHLISSLPGIEALLVEKPPLLPVKAYLNLAAKRAASEMFADISEHYPNQKDRMEGISRGADVDISYLFLVLSAEPAMARINYWLGACTAAGVAPERSAIGEPMLIKNFDYPEFFRPYYVTRLCASPSVASTLCVTVAPLAGCHDGMNEHGLCISYNYGHGTDMPKVNVPVSLLVQEALENCATAGEAVDFLCKGKRSGGAIILVADASGDMATVELSSNFSGTREPENGLLINTNHYLCRDMASYDIPRNAYYTSKNVRAMRGVRVHESSELRYERAAQLLGALEMVSMRQLLDVFCDHGESGRGDDNTLCRHGPYFSTTCSIIMLPAKKRMLVTYGHPCESVFTDFPDAFHPAEGEGSGG